MKRRLEPIVKKLKLTRPARHIFLCTGGEHEHCCKHSKGDALWAHLKTRCQALLSCKETPLIRRTKASCLRICQEGPVAVVYPEGAWYAGLNKETLDKIIDQHLVKGEIVHPHCFAISYPEYLKKGSQDDLSDQNLQSNS